MYYTYFMKGVLILLTTITISGWATYNLHAQSILKVNSNAVVSLLPEAIIYVNGDVQLERNSELLNLGSIFLSKPLNESADFTDNSINDYAYGSGKIIFYGTGIQHIKSINKFGQIEVDNKELTLSSNIKSDKWLLKSGKINTGLFYATVVSTATDAVEPGITNEGFSHSWFNGNLRRYILPTVVNNYKFPVGNSTKVYLCELDNLSQRPLNQLNYIDAAFSNTQSQKVSTNKKENGKIYTSLSNIGIWHLLPDFNPTKGAYDLKLYFDKYAGYPDNCFSILNNTGNNLWILPQGSVLPTNGSQDRLSAGGYAKRNNLLSFNQFGIGFNEPFATALPLSLTVYPDPVTNNEFFIKTGNNTIKDVKLFTIDNKEVNIGIVQFRKNDHVKVILPGTLPKAVYTVWINTANGIQTSRILVQ